MPTTIVWFRDDLRLDDNPALDAAAARGDAIVCLFVREGRTDGLREPGAASRWWLHHSLQALAEDLRARGARLVLRRGAARQIVPAVAAEAEAERIVWNRRYAPAERAVDAAVEKALRAERHEVETLSARLLHEPDEIRTKAGTPMRVFTPFWKAACARGDPRRPMRAPQRIKSGRRIASEELSDWKLLPHEPDWAGGIRKCWTPGAEGAASALREFLEGARGYGQMRDRPDKDATSRLSPHLHFGEISPVQIWAAARHAEAAGDVPARDIEKFLTELGWREFSYHLLDNLDDIAAVNVQRRFDAFPWRRDKAGFRAWTRGLTGYPLVDAGMRQLWRTGWMHNRVRMVAASFLIKHLMIDWREGEAWFWDTLVDADQASNPASWQWVAGSGADAAPYFRIFNPTSQGRNFDPKGEYVRRFVPELAGLPDEHIHDPSSAPAEVLAKAGIGIGKTYPAPIVDHAKARQRALSAFQSLKAAA